MADINTYALGLEFQLQAQPAIDAINKMVDASTDLAAALAKAGKSLNTKQQVYEYSVATEAAAGLTRHTAALSNAEESYARELQQGGIHTALSAKAASEHAEKLKRLKKDVDLAKDAWMDYIKEHKIGEEFFSEQIKAQEKREKSLRRFEEQVKNNTEALEKQIKPVKDLGNWLGSLSAGAGQMAQVVRRLTSEYGALGALLFSVGVGIKNLIEIQAAYVKSTYKMIGSQKDLIDTTLKLKSTFGVSTKEAITAVQAIAKVGFSAAKVGKEGIEKLVKANTQFTIATGVSASATARFQRELGILTGSDEAATTMLGGISQAMRNSGFTAEQAESAMSGLTSQLRVMSFEFNPKFAAGYAKEIMNLAAASHAAGGSAEAMVTQFGKVFKSVADARLNFALVGAKFDKTGTAADNMSAYLEGVEKRFRKFGGASKLATSFIAEALKVDEEFALSLQRMDADAQKAGTTLGKLGSTMSQNADLARDAKEAQAALGIKLDMLWHKFEALWGKLSKSVIPILEFFVDATIYVIDKIIEFHDWLEKLSPTLMFLVDATLLAVGAALALGGPLTIAVKLFSTLKSAITGIFKPMMMTNQAMAASRASSLGAGVGVRSFLTNLAGGLKALGTPQAMKGALTLGILTIAVAGSLALLALAMNKLGVSGKDMLFAAAAMVVVAGAMWIMSFAIQAVGKAGPKAALGAAILIGVMLALGVATMLAGLGIGYMAKGFAELFKAIPDIQTFLVVIGGLVLAMPTLAVGIAILGMVIAGSAPLILFGFILLAAAAALAYFVIPAFQEFGASLLTISTALGAIGPDAGARLVGLALGITAFMGALLGLAAGGAVAGLGRIFGVKSPLAQAEEIAAAMKAIAAPASMLGDSLSKLTGVGDIFKPLIDGILGRKEEIMEAMTVIMALATQVAAARQMIGETAIANPFAPFLLRAEPVKKPYITEDTARKIRDERAQSMMVENTKNTNESLKKVAEKLDQETLKELVTFLKEWLPKIATNDKDSGGLASAVNQWM